MEKKEVAVLAIQIGSIVDDFNHNLIKAERLITYNLDKYKADILILPEVWTCGWECSVFKSNAESLDNSRAIKFLGNIAKKYCVNVIGGSVILDKGAGICVNASPVFSREGKLVAIYEKNHLFSYYTNTYLYRFLKSISPLSKALTNNSAVARFVASGIL